MVKLNKIAGFSMPEVIIVTACLAVIGSLAYGDVNRMFVKQTIEQEKMELKEIEKALGVYAVREGKLPTDETECYLSSETRDNSVTYWNIELAKYSNLTPDIMCLDKFGNKRLYQNAEANETFANGIFSFKVYYSSVISGGKDDVIPGVVGTVDTPEWSGVSGSNGFDRFEPAEDDLMVKYTDKDRKMKLFEETLSRIETMEDYLERYARTKRAMARSADVADFDNLIMYPNDGRGVNNNSYLNTSNIAVDVLDAAMDAEELASTIGLPSYFGRNAITNKPMWYISNPGSNRSTPCSGGRPSAPYYPPVIMATTNDNRPTGC